MKKTLLLALFFAMPLLIQAVEKQENHSQSKGSNIVYIDVHIDQPNVEDCYETSLPDLQQAGWFKVYPNPNHGVFNLQMDQLAEGENVSIAIYDLAGKKVYSSDVPATGTQFLHELNLSTLPKGVYLIKVQVQQHSSVERLIIF